jgi:hypothetical protein
VFIIEHYFALKSFTAVRKAFSTALLQEFCGERIVGPGLWPPLSPDFLLLGFLTEKIHSNNPQILKKLKHNIEHTVTNIDPERLRKLVGITLKRVDACLLEGSGHFQHCCKAVL